MTPTTINFAHKLGLLTGQWSPRGVERCPQADAESHALTVEPRGVVNTGDAGARRIAANDVWR